MHSEMADLVLSRPGVGRSLCLGHRRAQGAARGMRGVPGARAPAPERVLDRLDIVAARSAATKATCTGAAPTQCQLAPVAAFGDAAFADPGRAPLFGAEPTEHRPLVASALAFGAVTRCDGVRCWHKSGELGSGVERAHRARLHRSVVRVRTEQTRAIPAMFGLVPPSEGGRELKRGMNRGKPSRRPCAYPPISIAEGRPERGGRGRHEEHGRATRDA